MSDRPLFARAPYLFSLALLAACGDDSSTSNPDADVTPGDADASDGTVAPDTRPDTVQPDTQPADTTPDIEEVMVPGSFGSPCNTNADCESGYCVDGPKGYVCTRVCDTSCPSGYDCKAVSGGSDVVFLCLPRMKQNCSPCAQDFQCAGGLCLQIDGEGRCAYPCLTPSECADGFECALTEREGAGSYCQPTTDSCSCYAEADGGQRSCTTPSENGVCQGVSDCDPETGWSECSAAPASPEVCNGKDDDCDGVWDDNLEGAGAPCQNVVEGVGACPGTQLCLGTAGWLCQGLTPITEVCNFMDDDCDGETDEGFRNADGRYANQDNCGGCGVSCTGQIPNATAFCSGAGPNPRCEVERCETGYYQAGPLTCLPVEDYSCVPCLQDEHCGTAGDRCIALDLGNFCARDCAEGNLHGTPAGFCPSGFTCRDLSASEGAGVRQCVPVSDSCDCLAPNVGEQRACTRQAGELVCLGAQTCDPTTGWSECSARTPVAETCNGQDDNCNAVIDDVEGRFQACTNSNNFGSCPGLRDCRVGPHLSCVGPSPAAETCNGVDDDCNGQTDEINPPLCLKQKGVCAGARQLCAGQLGLLECGVDSYGPGFEIEETRCDGLDNDCDGQTDEVDLDRDGQRQIDCGGTDCDDNHRLTYIGAVEICGDVQDNDCNGHIDDVDSDGDGWISAACGGEDCNDFSINANPRMFETCGDRVDNDCDGSIDNKDADGDGYVDFQCGGLDCSDARIDIFPGAAEICDGIDNNCNLLIDEKDADADGFQDVDCGGDDCDDSRPLVNPEGVEVCGNTIDENCSGVLDDRDIDGDGFLDKACLPFGDPNGDCDDYDAQTFAGALEVWDTRDNDCDGNYDEGVVPVGAVIITELMGDPDGVDDTAGEYFEVTNVSGQAVNMRGWRLSSSNDTGIRITLDVILQPGETKPFCASAFAAENGGVAGCVFEYGSGIRQSNSGADWIDFKLDSTIIDAVSFPSATARRALVLKPDFYTATANDLDTSWCNLPQSAVYDYDGGSLGPNYGTPGQLNPGDCSATPPAAVALAVPANGIATGGETVTLFGSGFTAATTVSIGGAGCAPVTVVSAWLLTCTTSTGTQGPANVVVTVGAQSATLTGGYTYTQPGNGGIAAVSLSGPTAYTIAAGLIGPIIKGTVDPSTGVRVEIGYGPGGTSPGTTANWRWAPAILLATPANTFGRALVITHALPDPTNFAYALRASTDGVIWRYTTTGTATITP